MRRSLWSYQLKFLGFQLFPPPPAELRQSKILLSPPLHGRPAAIPSRAPNSAIGIVRIVCGDQ
jgi:hypothetical protein